MSRATRMNVAVTANTAQFDRQMAKVRAKMKATQQGLSGGAGGALSAAGIGGGFSAGAGMLLRGSPLLAAIGGLTMALESSKRQSEEGRKDIGEIAQLALSPQRQQEAKFGAQLIAGEDASATDLMAVQKAFDRRFLDRGKERELSSLGIGEQELNKLNTSSIGQFTEDLIAMAKSMNDMQRLAVAETLGGKAGEMFLRAGQFQGQGDVSNAIGQMSLESVARAMSEEQQRQQGMIDNAGGEGTIGLLTNVWDLLSGQSAQTERQLKVLNAIADTNQQAATAARLGTEPEVREVVQTLTQPEPEVREVVQTLTQPEPEVREVKQTLTQPEPEVREVVQTLTQPEPEVREVTQTLTQPEPEVREVTQTLTQPEPEVREVATPDDGSGFEDLKPLFDEWFQSNNTSTQEDFDTRAILSELQRQTQLMGTPTGPSI